MWCGMSELHDAWDTRMALTALAEPEKLEARVFAAQFHWYVTQNRQNAPWRWKTQELLGYCGGLEGVRSASRGHILLS